MLVTSKHAHINTYVRAQARISKVRELQYSLCGPCARLDAHAAHAIHNDLPVLLCAHVLLHYEVVVVAKHGLGARTQDQHAVCKGNREGKGGGMSGVVVAKHGLGARQQDQHAVCNIKCRRQKTGQHVGCGL